ncbi:MAG: hypothetical protein P8046_07555 [Anaerolineales bacterium]
MMNKVKKLQLPSAYCKVREPDTISDKTPIILMLHGYSGDESAMWAFGAQIPESALAISIRAPYKSKDVDIGGYTWVDQPLGYWPVYQDFFPAVEFLKNQIKEISKRYTRAKFEQISLVGFSQGGAMAVVFTNLFSAAIEKLAMLSSFLPDSAEGFLSSGKFGQVKVFITHGNKDEMVSIELAHFAVKMISGLGSDVTYCEGDVGHQLDSGCFKALGQFLSGD